jgi:Flp pilus assembly protein TadD
MNRALALEASGNKDGAVQAYAAASAAQPDNQELRYAYAELLAASGKKARAVDELKRLVQGTDDARLLAAASRQLGKLDAFADCVAALDKAIRGKPTADLHVRRGVCRHDLKDNAGAKADYDAALALDAKYPPAHYYLGMHLREQGKKKEAATHLESAMKLGAGTPIAEAAKKALDELRKK